MSDQIDLSKKRNRIVLAPALTQDVEQEFVPEPEDIPLPKIIMRKRIQMVAPSGAVYSGTIHDEPMEGEGMPQ